MTTFIAERGMSEFPAFQPAGSGILCSAFGTIQLSTAPVVSDIYQMCRLPDGSVVTGGWLRMSNFDVGVESLDMDVGWADNGVESADSDGFGNFGISAGDNVTGYKPELGTIIPFGRILISNGAQSFNAETIIQVVVNTVAATFASGQMSVLVEYLNH